MAESSRVPDSRVENGGGLVRAIGPRLLLLFIIGDMLGTGIYVRVGSVAGEVGGAVWVAFLVGFEDSVNVAEETENPSRTFPRALFGGSSSPASFTSWSRSPPRWSWHRTGSPGKRPPRSRWSCRRGRSVSRRRW